MKSGKIVRRAAVWALALSVIPYQINKDEKSGTLEIRSLLWGLRKKAISSLRSPRPGWKKMRRKQRMLLLLRRRLPDR